MKTKIFLVVLVFLCSIFLTSCPNDLDTTSSSESSKSSAGTISGSTETWAYSNDSPVYTLDSSTSTLNITGLTSGTSNLYLVKLNTGSSTISSSKTGYVSASSGVSKSSTSSSSSANRAASVLTSDSITLSEEDLENDNLSSTENASVITNFVPPVDLNPMDVAEDLTGSRSITKSTNSISARSSLSASTSTTATHTATHTANKAYAVGDKKEIYVDQNSSLSTYAQETATLRAVGTYCYVWVVDDYYSTTASGDQIDSTIAEEYAALFDKIYPLETNVFGYESDELYNYSNNSMSEVDMSGYDTGTMVNIVVYDIASDYTSSSGSSTGIVGYFYCKDYYTSSSTVSGSYDIINYSNKGKYFYVDSYYANSYLETTYSTLAHEFQHMINWGVKDMEQDLSPSTWYNEMLSMLCEDMMQDKLDIDDDDSPKARLSTFNKYYYYSGVTEYREDSTSYMLVSYSTAYAFGAWLCRQYGGAALVQEIMSNDSVDEDSIADAVSEATGTTVSFSEILASYVQAIVFQDTALGLPTFNQDAAKTLTCSSYAYPMTAIDLWSSDYSWTASSSSSSSGSGSGTTSGGTPGGHHSILATTSTSAATSLSSSTSYTGPALLECGSSGRTSIRATGFTLHSIGTASSDTAVLTISQPSSSNETMYMMVE